MKTILTIMVLALVPALSRAEGDENERGKLIEALRRSAPEPRAAWGYVFNLDQRPDSVEIFRRHLVLKTGQFICDFFWKHIRARGKDLPYFD